MPAFPRAELEEMVERWLQANRDAEAAGDWRPMAELYAPDATYGWNYGPEHEFMAVGREQIRDVALGLERSAATTSELQSLMRTSYAVSCLKKPHTYPTLSE